MKKIKGYQGMFFDQEVQEKLIKLQKKGLSDVVKDMHITFKFGKIEQFPEELMDKNITVRIVGYASDGKNSGFQIALPEELQEYYKNENGPHITVSLGEVDGVKGRAVDTGIMDFEPIPVEEQVEVSGQLGYFVFGKGKIMNNSIFKKEEKINQIREAIAEGNELDNQLAQIIENPKEL